MLNPLWWLLAALIAIASKGRVTFGQALSRLLLSMGAVWLAVGALVWLSGGLNDSPAAPAVPTPTYWLFPTSPPGPAPTRTMPAPRITAPPRAATGTMYVTANALIVRDGPGSEYAIVGYLVQCDVVTVSAASGDWLRAQTPAGAGYVLSRYVSATADCR